MSLSIADVYNLYSILILSGVLGPDPVLQSHGNKVGETKFVFISLYSIRFFLYCTIRYQYNPIEGNCI